MTLPMVALSIRWMAVISPSAAPLGAEKLGAGGPPCSRCCCCWSSAILSCGCPCVSSPAIPVRISSGSTARPRPKSSVLDFSQSTGRSSCHRVITGGCCRAEKGLSRNEMKELSRENDSKINKAVISDHARSKAASAIGMKSRSRSSILTSDISPLTVAVCEHRSPHRSRLHSTYTPSQARHGDLRLIL